MPRPPTRFGLIIGAMKSGTTSLFELLAQHPQISASAEKEPSFFNRDSDDDEWRRYTDLWRWDPSRHLIALEASTSYSKSPLDSERAGTNRRPWDRRAIHIHGT